jgi:hypothetical protein
MGGGTPPPVERGCYFLLTLPPDALREPELRDDELLPLEEELREEILDELLELEDEEPTLAGLRPDDELPERNVELPIVPRNVEGRE